NRRPGEPNPPRFAMRVLGEGRADDRGLFRVPAEQTTADHYRLTAVAVAPGYAPSGRLAEPNTITAAEHNLTIQLVRGRPARVRPFPGPSLRVWVSPPPGRPYLELEQRLKWPAGAVAHQLALSPLRGVLVRGTVTEAGSGRPVAGAVVKYEHRTEGSPLQEKEPELLK